MKKRLLSLGHLVVGTSVLAQGTVIFQSGFGLGGAIFLGSAS